MKGYRTIAFCILFVLPLFALAQGGTEHTQIQDIEEVVVTGTLTERIASTLPVPTQIITGESIRQSGLSRLNEVIQEQTGLITVPDFGGGEGIQIQGMDAAYVMILIDGEPLIGRTAGTLDLSRISVNNIERVEVVKGASSSLYGSEALAGVVNIITRKVAMDGKPKINLGYKFGSFNNHDATMNFSYGKNKIGFDLFGNFYSSGGYNLTDNEFMQTVEPFRNFTINPKLKFEFSDHFQLTANARIYKNVQDYKTQISSENYTGKSTTNEASYSLTANHVVSDRLKFTYDILATHYQSDEYLNSIQGSLFEEGDYNQWYYRPEVRSHIRIREKDILTAGIGLNHEILDRNLFDEKASLSSEYIFGQYEWFLNDKWNVLAGFRFDRPHEYQAQFSPKLAINYRWTDDFSLKASVGYGYKAPDLRQLYLDFTNSTIGYTVLGYNIAARRLAELDQQGQLLLLNDISFNDDLKPESSFNFNIGGNYKRNAWTFNYNFFYNNISNLIDTRAVAQKKNGQNVFSYFNINKIFTYGAELNAAYQLNSQLKLSAGYQYLIAKDKSILSQLENGEIFARDPETLNSFKLTSRDYFGLLNRSTHTLNLKANLSVPSWKTYFNLRLFYRSKYGIFDSNSNDVLDRFDEFVKGYFLTNFAVTKEFSQKISVQVGANNLFNYTDKANITNLPGIQAFGKIMFNF